MTRPVSLLCAAALVVLISAGEARAQQDTATCAFLEIEATDGAKRKIDKPLKPLEKKLTRGPFKSKQVFSLIASHKEKLEKLREEAVKLRHGKMRVLFRQHSKPAGKKDRVTMSITMDDKKGKRVLETKVNVDVGDYVLVGRSLSTSMDQVVAVSCQVP